jgi:hypothetical protein
MGSVKKAAYVQVLTGIRATLKKRRHRAAALSIGAMTMFASLTAFADAAAGPSAAADADSAGAVIGEIVVTAQRRE